MMLYAFIHSNSNHKFSFTYENVLIGTTLFCRKEKRSCLRLNVYSFRFSFVHTFLEIEHNPYDDFAR